LKESHIQRKTHTIKANEYYAAHTRQFAPRAKYWPVPRQCVPFAKETSRNVAELKKAFYLCTRKTKLVR